MRRSGVFCSAVAAGLVMLVAARADAQSSGASTLADQLFAQGLALRKAGQWVEASRRFEDSLRVEAKVGTELNLALCYEHLGKLVAAWQMYQGAIALASATADTRRNYAWEHAAALAPRLPRLAVLAPAMPPPGFHVTRDGTPIDPAALGIPLYVDPGPHEIAASAPGFVTVTQTVTVTEASTETVALPALQRRTPPASKPEKPSTDARVPTAEPASSLAAPPRDDGAGPVAPSSTRRRTGLWVGAGGVAALGVGLVFGVKAHSSYSDAKRLCGADLRCDPVNYDQGKRSISDARSSATISTVLVAAGGVAIAAGAILFLTAPSAREHTAARLVPLADPHGAGLALTGGF